MLIVANWKMNGSLQLVLDYASCIEFKNVIVCPPYPLIGSLHGVIKGAQDCSAFPSGTHTGEVPASLLKEMGCTYVIVGHSERAEPRNLVREKMRRVLENHMTPIVCVCEYEVFDDFSKEDFIIAYEPIGAIGTGVVPSREVLQSVIDPLRHQSQTVLYGGSVNAHNASELKTICDGFLIGGASLNVQSMMDIVSLKDI